MLSVTVMSLPMVPRPPTPMVLTTPMGLPSGMSRDARALPTASRTIRANHSLLIRFIVVIKLRIKSVLLQPVIGRRRRCGADARDDVREGVGEGEDPARGR